MYQSKLKDTQDLFNAGMRYNNYISVSGGKDSLVMLHIATRFYKNFKAVMIHNEFEDDEVINLTKKIYPATKILRPKPTFKELILEYGLPRLNYRWCCYHMREKWSYKLNIPVVFLGIRAEESKGRTGRGTVWKFRNRMYIAPLYSWTEGDIWQYSADQKITQWSGYHKGETRFSCTLCPFRYANIKRLKDRKKKLLEQA